MCMNIENSGRLESDEPPWLKTMGNEWGEKDPFVPFCVASPDIGWRGNDEPMRLLADGTRDFAMIVTDTERNVVRWNNAATQVLGWTDAEVLGNPEPFFLSTPEDRAAGVPEHERQVALCDGHARYERWHMRKNGSRFWAVGALSPLYDEDTKELRGFGNVLCDMTDKKCQEEELRRANETLEGRIAECSACLKEFIHRGTIALERERQRISGELRDGPGQHLAALMLGLNALEESIRDPEALALLDLMRNTVGDLVKDVHRIAVELRSTALKNLGLAPNSGTLGG